jgi:hypothetical protein
MAWVKIRYRPERDKSSTPAKNGSDNIALFSLYGTASYRCQGGDCEVRFREEGLSAPLKDRVWWQEIVSRWREMKSQYIGASGAVAAIKHVRSKRLSWKF